MTAVPFKVDGAERPAVFTLTHSENAPDIQPRLLYVEQPEAAVAALASEFDG
jgi:hypothetical protein